MTQQAQPTNNGVLGLEIRAMRNSTKNMQPYQRQDCPICAWPLRTSVDQIIECQFCGWTDQNPLMRDVYRD